MKQIIMMMMVIIIINKERKKIKKYRNGKIPSVLLYYRTVPEIMKITKHFMLALLQLGLFQILYSWRTPPTLTGPDIFYAIHVEFGYPFGG